MGVKSGNQLKEAAIHRLADAYVLHRNRRYLAALYFGGYALEMTMKWALSDASGDAHVPKEYSGAKWHKLDVLLSLARFKNSLLSDPELHQKWSEVSVWDFNWRYESALPPDFRRKTDKGVSEWLKSVEFLIRWLNLRT